MLEIEESVEDVSIVPIGKVENHLTKMDHYLNDLQAKCTEGHKNALELSCCSSAKTFTENSFPIQTEDSEPDFVPSRLESHRECLRYQTTESLQTLSAKEDTLYTGRRAQEDLMTTKDQVEQLKEEISYLNQKNDLVTKNFKRKVIHEIRS